MPNDHLEVAIADALRYDQAVRGPRDYDFNGQTCPPLPTAGPLVFWPLPRLEPPPTIPERNWLNFRALEGYLDEWAATVLPQDWTPVSVYWVESPTSPVMRKNACTINHHGQGYLRCDIVTQQHGYPAQIKRWHMTVNLWNRDYRSPGLPRQLAQMAVAFVTECWRQLEAERR